MKNPTATLVTVTTLATWLALVACKQDDTAPPVPGTATTATESPPAVATPTVTTTAATAAPIPTTTASAAATATASAAPIATGSGGVVLNPPADAARDAKIQTTFGKSCRLERTCGALWGVDCNAAGDGPYWYVKAGTLEKVSGCGGLCRGGKCTNCPPKDWGCATY